VVFTEVLPTVRKGALRLNCGEGAAVCRCPEINGRHSKNLDQGFPGIRSDRLHNTVVGALVLHHLIPFLLHHHIRFPFTTLLGGGSVF
jgi:hypothetical protein